VPTCAPPGARGDWSGSATETRVPRERRAA
jgi:hypothetical protein